MAEWKAPKTTWTDGEYFNIDPDYIRIKGNIEYLTELAFLLYGKFKTPTLENADIYGYPKADFFNNIAEATRALLKNCYTPVGSKEMRSYFENQSIWNADDLNAIESNHQKLYEILTKQKSALNILEFTLGGNRFGK